MSRQHSSELPRPVDRTIDVTLSGQMQNRVGLKIIEQTRQLLASNQIDLFKSIVGMLFQIAKGIKISRISQCIEVQNMMPMCDETTH
jgi:hypothetical protein